MGPGTYSLSNYGDMIADRIRMDKFISALRATIRPGAVVMDIGTGPGIMAVEACRLGAARVYAIEPGEVIQVAREIAAANGCADKIEFFENVSTKITVPVRANLIVSDLRGVVPLFEQHIPSVVDARRRFLAPGGTLIGQEDRIWAAVVEAPDRYSKIVGPWKNDLPGHNLSPALRIIVNGVYRFVPTPTELLSHPVLWATLNYSRIEDPDVEGELTWAVQRDGTGHGIVIWFDADLAPGVEFSNGPGTPVTIYGSLFLPWERPVSLTAGQTVSVDLRAKLMENDYFWRWQTRIETADRPGEIAAQFDQSQLKGTVLSPLRLRKSASDYVPQLSQDGVARRRALELMDGKASLEEISRRLTEEFPGQFTRWSQALNFVGSISKDNSR